MTTLPGSIPPMLADPTTPEQAARKGYVDAVIAAALATEGQPNGLASLDAKGKLLTGQLDTAALAALLAPLVSALLTGGGAYAGTLSATQPTATRIYQRDTRAGGAFGKGMGAVGLTVTLSAPAAALDYRLRDADAAGNPVLQDWITLAGAQPAGITTLSPGIPAGPHRYLLDVCANGDTAHALLGTQPFGVGEVVAVAGQSLAYNALVSGLSPEGSIASAGVVPPANGYQFTPNLPDGSTQLHQAWATVADGTPADSAFAAEFLRLVTSQAGVMAALAGHAVGSTSITTWQPGQANYGTLRGVLDQVVSIGAFIWIQGHSDAQAGMSAGTYQGLLASLFNDLAAHYAGPGGTLGAFPRLICSIPALNSTYWGSPAAAQAIRSGALAYAASDSRARYVAALDMGLSSDGTHPNQAGRVPMARDFYHAFMGMVGLAPDRPGPSLAGATRAAGSAVVKLAVTQGTGGTALTGVGTPANQFAVYPAGTLTGALAIASLTIASATEVDLTLAAAPADSQALDVWYRLAGADTPAVTGSGVYDNALDGDGLTTGRQLRLAPAAITAAAPVPGTASPPGAFTVRSAPQGPVPSAVTVPVSGTGAIRSSVQVYAPDGTNSNTVAFALSASSTAPPTYGQGDDGVNPGDFQDFAAALGGISPATFACNLSVYPNGHAAGTSRTMYLWAFPKDGAGNYLPALPLTNPDGTPFAITVSFVASDGTLTGLPSTIVAGQPLSAATYSQSTLYFVLYRVAGAVEEGLRWGTNVMPGNLNLLVPQTAGAYTVRGFAAATGGTATYESAQFTVTAAPGALPATPTQAADTGTTSSGTTMNWSATAASYHVLARPGVGTVYGSLADVTVTTNSYTFTGLAANSSPRAVIIPQNANGYGTPSGQFLSSTMAAAAPASAPTGVTLSNATEMGMKLAWTAPSSGPTPTA